MSHFKLRVLPKIRTIGDIDERTKTILINKKMPKKFHKGIAVHELEERKWLKKGHSYTFSHDKAQKKELNYYAKTFGNKTKAKEFLDNEEKNVNKIFLEELRPK
jgi:hypothetical protein